MKIIESTVIKEKKDKKIIYSFEYSNKVFEAHYHTGKKPTLELLHNGSPFGSVEDLKNKHDFIINPDSNPVKLTVWIEQNVYSAYLGKVNGVGIIIDDIPVQHTLADPETHINNGRSGFYVLFFVLILKCIVSYYSSFRDYSSHLVSIISSAVYFLPLLIALIAFLKYKSWTKFSLIAGIVIAALELLDYVFAIPGSIASGSNGATLVIWVLIRVSALFIFVNAYKWKKTLDKAGDKTDSDEG